MKKVSKNMKNQTFNLNCDGNGDSAMKQRERRWTVAAHCGFHKAINKFRNSSFSMYRPIRALHLLHQIPIEIRRDVLWPSKSLSAPELHLLVYFSFSDQNQPHASHCSCKLVVVPSACTASRAAGCTANRAVDVTVGFSAGSSAAVYGGPRD